MPSKNDISLKLIDLVIMKLDICLNEFGIDNGITSFCTATGTRCWKTFGNCKDKANYQKGTREFKYSSTPVDFEGYRPYIKNVRISPTEILRDDTKSARLFVAMLPDTDFDVGIDPHYEFRAVHDETDYWPLFLARNEFFEGREITHHQGVEGQTLDQFNLKFSGKLDDVTVDALNTPTWQAVDQLQSIGQDDKEVPIKLEAELAVAITAGSSEMTLTNFDNVQTPGGGETLYVQVNDEIIGYTGVTPAQNKLTGLTRGNFFTTAAAHDADDAVKNTRYYAPAHPFDIMKDELLIADGGIDPAFIETADFTKYRDYPYPEINYSAIILEGDSAKVRELYFELVQLTFCRSWQGESGKIRIRRRVMNEPESNYRTIKHTGDIVQNSMKFQNKTKARYTRARIFWNKDSILDFDEVKSYDRITIGVDADIEGPNGLNKEKPFDVLDRWHWRGMETDENLNDHQRDMSTRLAWFQKYPPRVIPLKLHTKDSDIQTGEAIRLTTPRLRNVDNTTFDGEKFQVIKREEKADGVHVMLEEQPRFNIGYIADDSTPEYDLADEDQKEYGFIWSDDLLEPIEHRFYCII